MNRATPIRERFVLEEVNARRMRFVDDLMLDDVDRGALPDNRLEVHRFKCIGGCKRIAVAVDTHVGFVQHSIACPWCLMPADEWRVHNVPLERKDGELTVHVEFFRPLTDEQVEDYIATTVRAARNIVARLGGDPDDEDNDLRVRLQNARATRLLNGQLVPRNLVDGEET